MFIPYNPNPFRRSTGDCVTRAISVLTGEDWDTTFIRLCIMAYLKKDALEKGHVWGDYLKLNGYRKYEVPDMCPYCYTVRDFAYDHPVGVYLLRIDDLSAGHVVTVVDGDWYDTWDSGDEVVDYYYH